MIPFIVIASIIIFTWVAIFHIASCTSVGSVLISTFIFFALGFVLFFLLKVLVQHTLAFIISLWIALGIFSN